MILHSILVRKFLNINLQFLLYKVLYSERQVMYSGLEIKKISKLPFGNY